jgi:hypothetical protein
MHRLDFHVTGSAEPRPPSRATIFCDGTGGAAFRDGVDVELSHWIPNRTPPRFRADSSTEICLKFAAEGMSRAWDLAVNNHLDVDGILSMFAVVQPAAALARRDTLVGAAEMGDFAAWAEEPSQALYQGLTLVIDECNAAGVDVLAAYRRAFDAVAPLADGGAAHDPRVRPGLAALAASAALLDSGAVAVKDQGPRFAAFEVPRAVSRDAFDRALHVPGFNEALSNRALLWPQARARDRGSSVHLVSVEAPGGWYHDLWYPGYCWAETHRRPAAPGLVLRGDVQHLAHAGLAAAAADLARDEHAAGAWKLASAVSAFDGLKGRGFPVVMSFVGADDRPAVSAIPPGDVAARLAAAYSIR